MLWNTNRARSVSLLKLELQVEVDKVFVAAFLFARQQSRVPAVLNEWLFGAPIFHASLPTKSRNRYEVTDRCAGKYCALGAAVHTHRPARLEGARRDFYRSPQRKKLRHIVHAA